MPISSINNVTYAYLAQNKKTNLPFKGDATNTEITNKEPEKSNKGLVIGGIVASAALAIAILAKKGSVQKAADQAKGAVGNAAGKAKSYRVGSSKSKVSPNKIERIFNKDGKLFQIIKTDKTTGELINFTNYSPDGKIESFHELLGKGHGKITYFKEDGKTIKYIAETKNGITTESYIASIRGSISKQNEIHYDGLNQRIRTQTKFDVNGQKIEEHLYQPNSDKLQTSSKFNSDSGKIYKKITFYEDGKTIRFINDYDENGKLSKIAGYDKQGKKIKK